MSEPQQQPGIGVDQWVADSESRSSTLRGRADALYGRTPAVVKLLALAVPFVLFPLLVDSGYLMQPEECARIAELPNIVAIKYSVPREMYVKLTHMVGDKIQVSTSLEDDWLDNIEELGWQPYLCSSPPYHLQTKNDKRMHEYTQLAFAGKFEEARKVRDSLDPVRQAMASSKPADKPQAFGKYWQELLGQVGGRVRPPMLELTAAEKAAIKNAFDACGLKL